MVRLFKGENIWLWCPILLCVTESLATLLLQSLIYIYVYIYFISSAFHRETTETVWNNIPTIVLCVMRLFPPSLAGGEGEGGSSSGFQTPHSCSALVWPSCSPVFQWLTKPHWWCGSFFFLSKTKTRRRHNLSAKVAKELLKQGGFFWPNKAFCWKLATKMNVLNVEMAHLCSWRLLKNSFEVIGIWLAFTLEVCRDMRLQHSLYEATGYHKTDLN